MALHAPVLSITADPLLSGLGPQLSWIENDCFIRVFWVLSTSIFSIRVFQWSSVYKSMGFDYPDYLIIQTLLKLAENKQVWITEGLPYYHLKKWITQDASIFYLLYSSTDQQLLFDKNLCNQSSYYMGNFRYRWKSSHACHKINIFPVRKDEWDTKVVS